ncbi:MAG: hypothetical protein IT161_13785 [Bryobacterales bacterium]|nr:hypothetical protein [Bryobacterales bacterium]
MLVGERLTGNGWPALLGRLTLTVSAFGCLLLIMRRWWRQTVDARLEPPKPGGEGRCEACHGSAAPAPDLRLSANLKLAADHVESIRTLIEVSEAHQQPVPRAAFQNLELVSKHLRGIERQLEAGPLAAHLEHRVPGYSSPS